jgi:ABC-type branched-subunit amino acid transport system ATPase component/ABC-type branched-subunit amino acid transport system permease subunit
MTAGLTSKYRPVLVAAACLVTLPFLVSALGLSLNTASAIVFLTIAALGLNMMVGYTGLVSFGHAAWFGIGGYASALAQLHLLPDQIVLPILCGMVFVAVLATLVGILLLRRRGVYFALMTLALCALTYTIAFRWTAVTGGEDGLGGLERGSLGPVDLNVAMNYYVFVAVIGLGVLYLLVRVVRSPFGHVLVAIRENQMRATFQGYPVQRYKLAVFVLSATITALAGSLSGFQHYIVSAEGTSIEFSGELLAMVVIGGMHHHILGPAVGVTFYVLFRELFSIWTGDWLFWFGLIFVAFVMYSPGGLVGIGAQISRRLWPLPEEDDAMGRRRIHEGLPLPEFLRPPHLEGTVLDVQSVSKRFGGIQAVRDASLKVQAGEIHALIGPNGAGKTTLFNLVSGAFPLDSGRITLYGAEIQHLTPDRICQQGLARSFQITNLFEGLSIYENLRLSTQARHRGRFNFWHDVDSFEQVNADTAALVRFLGLQGIEAIKGSDLSYGGQRLVDLGIALASRPRILLLDEPLAGLAAAERERISNLIGTISSNIPVLLVEHDIDRVLALSHEVTVMNQGEVLVTGAPELIRDDLRVQELYTGKGKPALMARQPSHGKDRPIVLRAENLNTFYGKSHILNDASLDVRKGEIVALLGRNGAGKSTFLKSLAGLVPPASGSILFEGRELAGLPAYEIARLGIGYVPQNRGLFAGMTVAENLGLGRLARQTEGANGTVWSQEQILESFPRLKDRLHTPADYLSGGEQQMLTVARALSGNVRLLLLDEPFEGLAPTVIEDLFVTFDKLREHLPIVIVEHNLDLVLALANSVFVLERGAVFHQGPANALLVDLEYRKQVLWL